MKNGNIKALLAAATLLAFGLSVATAERKAESASPKPPVDTDGRPLIRKLGTIGVDLCETSPFVFKNQLYRLEWHRNGNHLRVIDHDSRKEVCHFGAGYAFPCVLVEDGTIYVVATYSDRRTNGEHTSKNGRNTLTLFTSTDLKTWETKDIFHNPKFRVCNTSMCKADDRYVMSFEIGKGSPGGIGPWTGRFMESKDLRNWSVLPLDYSNNARGGIYAPHMLRWHDGYFYSFATVGGWKPSPGFYGGYVMTVRRSPDLKVMNWEKSPFNPVINGSEEDRKILNPDISAEHRKDIAENAIRNNSDLDVIEWQGKLIMNYCWGTQGGKGHEYVAEAEYDGTLAQFLEGWFPAGKPKLPTHSHDVTTMKEEMERCDYTESKISD